MKDFKSVARTVGYHGMIMLRGFAKMMYGTATAGLIGLAVYGFWMIPSEGGYTAVCDFIAAVATLTVALTCTYAFGCSKKKKYRYASNG